MLIDQFAAQLDTSDSQALADVRSFVDWQSQRLGRTFIPDRLDDVAIRSYLLHLKVTGARRARLRRNVASLSRFYDWAQTGGLIAKSPFASFDFNRHLLGRGEIRRREGTRFADKVDREIAHLRALNQLGDQLNRSADMRTLMDMVVETLVQVMGLKTAWAFLWTEAGFQPRPVPIRLTTSSWPDAAAYRQDWRMTIGAFCANRPIATVRIYYVTSD